MYMVYLRIAFWAVPIALHVQTSLQRWHPTHLLPISSGLLVYGSKLIA